MLSLHLKRFSSSLHKTKFTQATAVAIGGFDGIHRGHQVLLKQLKQLAKDRRCLSTVILFYPLPQEFFSAQTARRIYPFAKQIRILEAMDIDQVICLRFDKTLSEMSSQAFVDFIVEQVRPCSLLVGDDFHFGYQRAGDFDLLKKGSLKNGFEATQLKAVCDAGTRISSTQIRQAIHDGDFALASQWLGRDYAVEGRIKHGDGRGKQLGFPTANMIYGKDALALDGVYIGEIEDLENASFGARKCLIHSGMRPTFNDCKYSFEVHIPEFEGDLYGHRVRVCPQKKLRDIQKFDSVQLLQKMIKEDIAAAKENWAKQA